MQICLHEKLKNLQEIWINPHSAMMLFAADDPVGQVARRDG